MNSEIENAIEYNNVTHDGKIPVTPHGSIVGKDGRTFFLDAEKVIKEIKNGKSDIPLLAEHGYSYKHGESAFGWFDRNSFEYDKKFIYAKLNKTNLGEQYISQKHYKYLSPAFRVDYNKSDREVITIPHIGLVNQPNLKVPEVNKQEEQDNITTQQNKEETMPQGLEYEKKVFNNYEEGFNHLKVLLDESREELNNLQKQLAEKDEENKAKTVDLAIAQNNLLPKDREFALSLNQEQLKLFIEKNSASNLFAFFISDSFIMLIRAIFIYLSKFH